MININFTNIDNSKLIGRLLPFWANGKRISLLLQALLSPIEQAHSKFQHWALDTYIECHITAQRASLEWYLKYKLKPHFYDKNDTFLVAQGDELISCFSNNIWTNELFWVNQVLWGDNMEMQNQTVVYAPRITESVDYTYEDYKRDIRNIISKYMINFNKINIIIANETNNLKKE